MGEALLPLEVIGGEEAEVSFTRWLTRGAARMFGTAASSGVEGAEGEATEGFAQQFARSLVPNYGTGEGVPVIVEDGLELPAEVSYESGQDVVSEVSYESGQDVVFGIFDENAPLLTLHRIQLLDQDLVAQQKEWGQG